MKYFHMKTNPTNPQYKTENSDYGHIIDTLSPFPPTNSFIPSPATRFDVDGLASGVGWVVGAGVAVAGYLLQR